MNKIQRGRTMAAIRLRMELAGITEKQAENVVYELSILMASTQGSAVYCALIMAGWENFKELKKKRKVRK